ncbi:MAG: hypothetical protein COB59_07180 [Rhodospirillaceae bacterium]|nr:MAG: hypothetical protein COB59_07180 [Rhodospirillaceae bacterium]
MVNSTITTIANHIKKFEKPVNYPYLDNKGKVTAGAGFLMDTEAAFLKAPFEVIDQKTEQTRSATEAEKRAGWQAMQAKKTGQKGVFNNNAKVYKKTTTLIFSDTEIDKRVNLEVTSRIAIIKNDVGDKAWDKLTDGQKTVLVDVSYTNTGGSIKSYDKLVKAVKAGDAAGMARESHYHSTPKGSDGPKIRNWGRIKANHCGALGLDTEGAACYKSVAEHYSDDKGKLTEDLPASYDAHIAKDARSKLPAKGQEDKVSAEPTKTVGEENAAFQEQLKAPENSVVELARKQPDQLTADERKSLHQQAVALPLTDPKRATIQDKVKQSYVQEHGNGAAEVDASGRIRTDAAPQKALPTVPQPAKDINGQDVAKGVLNIGGEVSRVAQKTAMVPTVASLQKGINALNKPESVQPALKVDGAFGPKTKEVLGDAVASFGADKVEKSFGLGQVESLAEQAKSEQLEPGTLGDTVSGAFDGFAEEPEKALQNGLNALSEDGAEPLKVDGWAGPKTEDAFAQAAKSSNAFDFSKTLGSFFGLS